MAKKKYEYMWTSYRGTYYIPCKVIHIMKAQFTGSKSDTARIEYDDPICNEKITKIVLLTSIKEIE